MVNPTTKTCSRCKSILDISEFGKNRNRQDGIADRCLVCKRTLSANHRLKYAHTQKYRDRMSAAYQRWRKRHPGRKLEHVQASQKKYPEHHKTRQAFTRAVFEGLIERKPCIVCASLNANGHHEDYSKPFDVIWLCTLHHGRRHVEIRKGILLSQGFLGAVVKHQFSVS